MTPIPHRFLERNPMTVGAAGVVAGLAFGTWPAVVAGAAGLAWFGFLRFRGSRYSRQILLPGLFVVTCLLAAWRMAAVRAVDPLPPDGWAEGSLATVEGVVSTPNQPPPGVDQRAWFHLRGKRQDGKPLQVRVYLPEGTGAPLPGSRVRAAGLFHPPRPPRNPGEWDEAEHWRRLGIVGAVECLSGGAEILAPAPWWHPLAFGEASRRRLAAILAEGIADPDQRAVVLGITLGLADGLGDSAMQSFRRTGSLHLFAVSGLHVSLLAGVVWVAAGLLGLGRRASAWVILPAILLQALVTGCEPPALRATLGMGIFLAGLLADKSPRVLNSLAAAAVILLLAEPRDAHDLGFQLTFCVALALVVIGAPLARALGRIGRPDPFVPEDLVTSWQRKKWGFCRGFTSTFAVGLAANIGSFPLSLHHFNLVTPSGVVLGFALVPLSSLILALGLLALPPAFTGLGVVSLGINKFNAWLAGLSISLCQTGAALPGAWWLPPAPLSGTHEVLVLDLDRGGASMLVRGPQASLVIDTGNPGHARRILAPACARLGAMPPEALVLTHEDVQHRGGFLDFAFACGQPRWMLAGPSQGRWSWADGSFDVLFPPAGHDSARADDRASVLRFGFGNARLLWVGDAGFDTQKALLARGQDEELHCDVMCVGWHANDIGLLREFAAAAAPRLAVFHRYRMETTHPPDEVLLGFLRERGITVWEQEKTGAVTLAVFPDRIEASCFLDPALRLTLPVSASAGAAAGWPSPASSTGPRNP